MSGEVAPVKRHGNIYANIIVRPGSKADGNISSNNMGVVYDIVYLRRKTLWCYLDRIVESSAYRV